MTVWSPPFRPQHPVGHGPLKWELDVADGVVISAEPIVAPLHRGAEKLFESRDYRAALALANRHDWFSAFNSELGLALGIESMLAIAVPTRASWLRIALAEISRIAHHAQWLAATALELGEHDVATHLTISGEAFIDLQEQFTGGRMHTMIVAPGGLRTDAPQDWLERVAKVAANQDLSDTALSWLATPKAQAKLSGVVPIDAETVAMCGASGPLARASNVPRDLRFDSSYCEYKSVIESGCLNRVVGERGDAFERLRMLALEIAESCRALVCISAEAEKTNGQPVSVRLPRVIRLPEGEAYAATEGGTGVNGWFIKSTGGPEPYRLHIRSASFGNARAFSASVRGCSVAAFPTAVMSSLVVPGDLGK